MDDDVNSEQNADEENYNKKKTRNDILSNNAVLKFYVQIRWIEIKTAQHEAATLPTMHISLALLLSFCLNLVRCAHFFVAAIAVPLWTHNVRLRALLKCDETNFWDGNEERRLLCSVLTSSRKKKQRTSKQLKLCDNLC